MAYRCKCCGYIFKSSDSDLCPECFTARDDTKCSDMERGHTHFKERSKEKNDFLDDQLREERKAAKEDFGEDYNIRDDSARKSRYTQNYTGTYNVGAQQSYGQPHINSAYNGGKSTLRFTNGFDPNAQAGYSNTQYNYGNMQANYGNMQANYGNMQAYTARTAKTTKKIVVAIIIIAFVLPIIASIGLSLLSWMINRNTNDEELYGDEKSGAYNTIDDVELLDNGFSARSYNEDVEMQITNIRLGKSYSSLEEIQQAYPNVTSYYGSDDVYSQQGMTWRIANIDIDVDEDSGYIPNTLTLYGYDDDDQYMYSVSSNVYTAKISHIDSLPIFICESCKEIKFYIYSVPSDDTYNGESVTMITDYDEIAGVAAEDDSDLELIGSNYNYSKTNNNELKNITSDITLCPAKNAKDADVKEYAQDMTIYDKWLEDSAEWKLAGFDLKSTDDTNTKPKVKILKVGVTGQDAYGKTVYEYLPAEENPAPELLICDKVQNYTIVLKIANESGYEMEYYYYMTYDELAG